jgi:PAS domain S-box-containing protein
MSPVAGSPRASVSPNDTDRFVSYADQIRMSSSPPAASPLLAAALDALITTDGDGRIVDLNPAAEQMFGYSRAHALGRFVADFIIPRPLRAADREGIRRANTVARSTAVGKPREYSVLRADGREIPVELIITQTSDEPRRYTAWIHDLSECREAQAECREAQAECQRLNALLERAEELAGLGSWAWSPDGSLRWTDNLFRVLGLEPGSVVPTVELFVERIHPQDRGRVVAQIDAARREGRFLGLDMRIVRPDGTVRELRASAGTPDPHSSSHDLVGTVHDVTEQRLAEREIAAQAALSEALGAWQALAVSGEPLLSGLASALGFDTATLWLPQAQQLEPRLTWSASGVADEPEAICRPHRELERAWKAGEPIEWPPDSPEQCPAADRPGVDGAAVPVLAGDEPLAVVELREAHATWPRDRLLRTLSSIGLQLGSFLVRRRGELVATPLTPREIEVLQLAALGCTGRQIAERLIVSPATVKSHFENMYARLGVSDRAAAVAYGLRQGLIE